MLLQIDRVRADDGLALLLQGKRDGRNEVGERFTNASGGFANEGVIAIERSTDKLRHALLLRAILELWRLGHLPVVGEGKVHARSQRRARDAASDSFFVIFSDVKHARADSRELGAEGKGFLRLRLFATLEPHDAQAEFFGEFTAFFWPHDKQSGGEAVGLGSG